MIEIQDVKSYKQTFLHNDKLQVKRIYSWKSLPASIDMSLWLFIINGVFCRKYNVVCTALNGLLIDLTFLFQDKYGRPGVQMALLDAIESFSKARKHLETMRTTLEPSLARLARNVTTEASVMKKWKQFSIKNQWTCFPRSATLSFL